MMTLKEKPPTASRKRFVTGEEQTCVVPDDGSPSADMARVSALLLGAELSDERLRDAAVAIRDIQKAMQERLGRVVTFDLAAHMWVNDNQAVAAPVLISRRDYASLVRQCRRDPLTGLLNSTALYELLERELAASARYGHCVALLFVDLDRFKGYNDRCGRDAGDTLLRDLGALLENAIRRGDAAARCGGGAFALVVRNASPEEATRLARRLVRSIATRWRDVGVTASIGVSVAPVSAALLEDLVTTADDAMCRAKGLGGNTFAVASPAYAASDMLAPSALVAAAHGHE
jgi:diguanylate cyclase (GGDEF)-like protein